jgi:hypothetical protein
MSSGAKPGTNMNEQEKADVDALPLLDGEKIIWSARPAKWKKVTFSNVWRVIWTIILMGIPVGFIVGRLIFTPNEQALNWFIFIPAGIWILIALYRLLAKLLSNLRGFVVQPMGRNRKMEILFLDGLGPHSKLEEHADGSGDLKLGHQLTFEGIPNCREVHRLIMETIQNATGTFEGEGQR